MTDGERGFLEGLEGLDLLLVPSPSGFQVVLGRDSDDGVSGYLLSDRLPLHVALVHYWETAEELGLIDFVWFLPDQLM